MQTITEKLSNPSQAGSSSMSSVKDQLLDNFKSSKEYRHAFVEEKVRTQLTVQIKAIREQRQMGRPEFATLMQKAPSWVFRLEDPNQSPPTISTLLQVAEAFDVDLDIRFRRFSGLLDQLERMTPESFEVPSFEEEVKDGIFELSMLSERESAKSQTGLENLRTLLNILSQEPAPLSNLLMGPPEPPQPSPTAASVSKYDQTGAMEVPVFDHFGDKQSNETNKVIPFTRRRRPEKTGKRIGRTA